MMPGLHAFLARGTQLAEEQARWPAGTRLAVAAYLHRDLTLLEIVTSVRCLLRRGDGLLVFTDHEGAPHVLPGGRREPGETLEETLRRELLEETGWTIGPPRLLGCLHFRHLTPRPPEYQFPYPDFLQVVYLAETRIHYPDRRVADEWVTGIRFLPLATAHALPLGPTESAHLRVALDCWAAPDREGYGHVAVPLQQEESDAR